MSNISFFWLFLIIFIALLIFSLSIFFSVKQQGKKKKEFILSRRKIRDIFRKGILGSEKMLLPKRKKYDYPWVILLNEGGENNRIPIEEIDVTRSSVSKNLDGNKSFFWHYFSKGLILEFSSNALAGQNESSREEIKWAEFLKLCNRYRPRRPIDSIVISVPANILLDSRSNIEAKTVLKNLSKITSQRIWMVQNSFSIRIPVYLIVSGCEEIQGFSSFAQSLPKSMRNSILGWSNPNDLFTIFSKKWIVQAIDEISARVSSLVMEMGASHPDKNNRLEEFLLPLEIKNLQNGLVEYTEGLVESSGFYEPFFFRGIFMVTNHKKPSFTKDLFGMKFFGEFGLLRPSNNQRFKNSEPNKIFKWLFFSFISFWSIGLVFSAIKGHQVVGRLTDGISGLNEDARQRNEASRTGNTLNFEWYRKTAVSLIIGLEELENIRFKGGFTDYGSIFIPGSLPIFDDVFLRANTRVREDFGELVVDTFKRSLELKTADLTGSYYDPVTGRLSLRDNTCKPPERDSGKLAPPEGRSLKLSDSPNFRSLETFLAKSKELERAVLAMNRLRYNGRSSNDDFRYLTSFALQVDLYGDLSGVTSLFNKTVNKNKEVISSKIISNALKCSLIEGVLNLNDELFSLNSLLEDERKIVEAQERFLTADFIKLSGDEIVELLEEILSSIQDQEILLTKGGGLWMLKDQLDLGDNYEEFLQEIQNNTLLGPNISSDIKVRANKEFGRLRVNYESLVLQRGTEEGIEIGRNDNGNQVLILSEKRRDLQKAIEKLLSEPIMSINVDSKMTINEDRPIVEWDTNYLDDALTLRSSRDKYLNKDLILFPTEYRDRVLESIDNQVEKKIISLIRRAYSNRAEDSIQFGFDLNNRNLTTYFNSLSKLSEVLIFMKNMNQGNDIQKLKEIILNDAVARENILNEGLNDVKMAFMLGDEINFWDYDILQRIVSLQEMDDSSTISKIPSFEKFESKIVEDRINKEKVLNLFYLLKKAYSGKKIDDYIASFNLQNENSEKYLKNLRLLRQAEEFSRRSGHNNEAILIENIIISDAANRLGVLNNYLSEKDFLLPAFERVQDWDGGIGLIESSYSVQSFMELKEFFRFQMSELEKISDLAKAYLDGLPTKYYKSEKNYWGMIGSEIYNYNKNIPSSTLMQLQNFLEDIYEDFSIENCRDKLDKVDINKNNNNFFFLKYGSIVSEISKRCDSLRRYSIQERWVSASLDYKNLLLKKKPFANKVFNNISAKDYQALEEASLFEVVNVFSKFPPRDKVVSIIDKNDTLNRVTMFYSNLDTLKSLFSPYLVKSKEDDRGYEVDIEVRGGRDGELYGNKIISWVFHSGGKSINILNDKKDIEWNFGEPVKLELRFASDTNVSPQRDNQNPFYRVSGKTAIYSFPGSWGLLDMINMHKVTKEKNAVGDTLKFEFPVVIDNEVLSKGRAPSNARIFFKIILKRKIDSKALKLPLSYVKEIPQL